MKTLGLLQLTSLLLKAEQDHLHGQKATGIIL
jgi:hypothetical protein